jgi:hypothetical protein
MSKGNEAPAPDFTSLAVASQYATDTGAQLGREQMALGREQLAAAERVYERQLGIADRVADAQVATMEETRRQAQQYFNHWDSNFRGMEEKMVREAQDYDTAANRERLTAQAAQDAATAFAVTKGASERNMRSMGIDPRSGRYQAMDAQSDIALAGQRAAAMNSTRNQAQQIGWAKRLDAAGLGRGMPGASAAAYGAGTNAGVAAGNVMNQAGSTYLSGLAMGAQTFGQGAGTVMQGAGQGIQGYSSMVGSQTSYANAITDANAQLTAAGIGAAGGLASKFL